MYITPFLKVVFTTYNVDVTHIVFRYRIPLQSLFPLCDNPACSWRSVTTSCSIQNRKISSCSLIQYWNISSNSSSIILRCYAQLLFHLLLLIYEHFSNGFTTPSLAKLRMKLSHQLSIISDAVLNFTRRVYCTRICFVNNRCCGIHSVGNRSVYLSSIMR